MAKVLEQINTATVRGYVETESRVRSAAARLTEEEAGQSTAEYVAIIVLIAAVGAAVATFANQPIVDSITNAISNAFGRLSRITGGGGT